MQSKSRRILSGFCCLFLPLFSLALSAGEDADFRRAQGYYTLQEYQLAAESFQKFNADFPRSDRADQAHLLLAESQYQLAYQTFEKSGMSDEAIKRYSAAAAVFDAFIEKFPKSEQRSSALLRAVKAHYLLKNYEKSLKAAEAFLAENRPKLNKPDSHPALPAQLGTVLYSAGEAAYASKKTEDARKYWEELVSTLPNSPLLADANDGLGWINFDAKEYEKAISQFKVTAQAPQHPRAAWAKLMEGRSLAALKKFDEALAAFKAAPSLSGSNRDLECESVMRQAETLLDAGRIPDALENYRKLAKDFTAQPAAAPAIAGAALRVAELQKQAESLALADVYLEKFNGPDRASMLRIKARAQAALGKGDDTIATARKAVEEAAALQDPARKKEEHPAALMLLAEKLGKHGAEQYGEIVKLYGDTRFAHAARYELARIAAEENRIDEAIKEIDTLLTQLGSVKENSPLAALQRDAMFAGAEFAFRKADYKKSHAQLAAYRQIFGDSDVRADDVLRKLAWCRFESNDAKEAAGVLDEALNKFSKSKFRDEMLYLRALAAAKAGPPESALPFNESLIKEFPDSQFADDALFDAASVLSKQSKVEPALEKLNLLIDSPKYAASPFRLNALQLRATINLQRNKGAESQSDSDAAIKIASAKDETKAQVARLRLLRALSILSQLGKENDAETAFTEIISAGPESAPEIREAHVRRAMLRFNAKKYGEAKSDFEKVAADLANPTPEITDAALRLAMCHRELKENDNAKAVLEKLNKLNLTGSAAFEAPFHLGNLHFEAAKYAEAQPLYDKALAAAPDVKDLPAAARSAATLNVAWCWKYLNEKEKAEKAFGKLIADDPNGSFAAEALYERARLLGELGKLPDALALFKVLLEKPPDNALAEKAMFSQAQMLAQNNQFKEAAEAFTQFTAKFANSPSAREAWCGLGECQMRLEDFAHAKESFTKALGEKGADADLNDMVERAILGLSECNLKQNEYLAAKKLTLRILADHPESKWADSAYFFAGQASEGLNEPEKAIGYYRKLIAERAKSPHIPAANERLRALGAPK